METMNSQYRHMIADRVVCNTATGAVLSECRRYRYALWRIWNDSKPKVLFIMLNPSTADAMTDDPTIRRCIGFARYWGFGGMMVANIFAARSTNPDELLHMQDMERFGEDNIRYLYGLSQIADRVVLACGAHKLVTRENIKRALPFDCAPHCIETTKGGFPAHPLYLKATLTPEPYFL